MSKGEKGGKERRRYPRLQALYLLSYINKEGGVQKTGVSMARTINLSLMGVGVEVYEAINCDSVMEMEIAVKDIVYAMQGKVIHSQEKASGNYIIGIQFDQVQKELAKEL
ncbi:MAG: PilZ domain-containing protein [Desulfobacterales bacterium]|nr:PilZ domain-containing protein [Desulfobacterales bacterium]